MSEGPEDVEGCCKGFLFLILAIVSFKIEITSFTFRAILFWSREVLGYRRPSDTVPSLTKWRTQRQSIRQSNHTTKQKHNDKANLRRDEDWMTTKLMYDKMKTGRRHKSFNSYDYAKITTKWRTRRHEEWNTTMWRAIFHGIKKFWRHEM